MRFQYNQVFIVFCLISAVIFNACKKEPILTTGGRLTFSTDTLTIDTVFTAMGSTTREVRIYNQQNRPVIISSVHLAKGAASPFHLNVDGQPGYKVNDIEIAANDSIFVFATVTIDPTNDNTPFVVEDQLVAQLNGTDFSIPILAYGQNAYYIKDSVLTTQTWLTDKPYVIINNALVDTNQILTIPAGARIYNHAGSRLFVEGTLIANGTKTDSIVFLGDRIDRYNLGYEGVPGEWGGLYFTQNSKNNVLTHVHFLNGGNSSTIGKSLVQPATIQVDAPLMPNSTPQLILNKVTIRNSLGYGILSFGGTIEANNCNVSYCGSQGFAGLQGGYYDFNNCTFGGYGTSYLKHTDNPIFAVLNFLEYPGVFHEGDLYATFTNCIIYGTLDNEFVTGAKGSGVYNVSFKNCLIKAKVSDIQQGTLIDATNIFNQDPQFEKPDKMDFHIKPGSPAQGKAATLNGFNDDLDDRLRSAPWDIGCYEIP